MYLSEYLVLLEFHFQLLLQACVENTNLTIIEFLLSMQFLLGEIFRGLSCERDHDCAEEIRIHQVDAVDSVYFVHDGSDLRVQPSKIMN